MLLTPAPLTPWLETDGAAIALAESFQGQGAGAAEEPKPCSKVLLSKLGYVFDFHESLQTV